MRTPQTLLATLLVALLLPATAGAQANAPSPVADTSYALPGGERVLELSAVVAAPLAEAWEAFTTAEGFRSWAAPAAWIDLRVGGEYEASYDKEARQGAPGNIRNRILALVPLRLVVIQNVQAPPNTPFDAPAFQRTHTAIHFAAVDDRRTRVTLQNAGYLPGEPYDTVLRHFRAGNRWTLEQMVRRFEKPAPR